MAKLSKEEAKQLEALNKKLEAADDDDYEVWIKNDSGHEVRVPRSRAASWLKKHGFDFDAPSGEQEDDDDADDDDDSDGDGDPKDGKKTSVKKGYWGGGKK